jgi:ribosomal protein S18 acetylase RimI-like enzyme
LHDAVFVTHVPTGTRPRPALRRAAERLLRDLDAERRPEPANLDALLADPAARLVLAVRAPRVDWAALDEATVVGMLTLTFRNSLTRTSAHIDHVVVDAAHRRQGIATAMLEHAVELARAGEATRIDLTSAARRRAAARLYLSCGFQRRETVNWRRSL